MGDSLPTTDLQTVLIVDDDQFIAKTLERDLSNAGYKVLTATNGAEALEILQSQGPRLLITDWAMPVMSGIELCRAIHAHDGIENTFIILLTGRELEEENLVEALHAGADDFLVKPYRRREMLARLGVGERLIRLQEKVGARSREVHRQNAAIEIVNIKLTKANAELARLATMDDLTGLLNRREAMARADTDWVSSVRHDQPLSLVAIDIDHFKKYNDAYGHAVGDKVLRGVADVLLHNTRREECVYRVGGEEFLLLCPQTDEAGAAAAAERLRCALESHVIRADRLTLCATGSFGVAERTPAMQKLKDLLAAADSALLAAKNAGRNTVCRAGQSGKVGRLAVRRNATAPPMAPKRDQTPANILVVDDDEFIRTLARRFLERDGHLVIEAQNGAEAIHIVGEKSIDVIIMDAVMPVMDGLTCTRKLKEGAATRSIPVIIASGRTDASDIVAGLEAGADEYLTKPINPKELSLRVMTMVRLRRELKRSNEVRGEQSRALELLLDFSRAIAWADSLQEVLTCTVDATSSLVGCSRISLMLPDTTHQTLLVVESIGLDEKERQIRAPIDRTDSGRVFQSGKMLVIDAPADSQQDDPAPDTSLLAGVPAVSIALAAPAQAVGVLNVADRRGGRSFSNAELEYLDLIAHTAAAAIHERLTRRARDDARYSIVVALAKLAEHRDSDTGRHLDRVTRFCLLLAKELRSGGAHRDVLTNDFIGDLERAVPLHDIGKVAIPDDILLKPAGLTAEERAIMETHAEVGARTLRSVIEKTPGVSFLVIAEQIAHAHHEWFDGNGYPRKLSGSGIPLAARIVSVADVYDAVTTVRPYKKAMSHDVAANIIIEGAATQFDPEIVEAFMRCQEEFKKLAATLVDAVSPEDATESTQETLVEALSDGV